MHVTRRPVPISLAISIAVQTIAPLLIPDEESLLLCQAARHREGVLFPCLLDSVDDRTIEVRRNEARSHPLKPVGASFFARDHRAPGRFDGDDEDVAALLLEVPPDPRDRPSRSASVHERVNPAFHRIPEFGTRVLVVGSGIRRVRELVGHEGSGVVPDLLGDLDGRDHPQFGVGEDEVGSVRLEGTLPLHAHRRRKAEPERIATRCRHLSQADAGVAGGRFDDGLARNQDATLFRVEDHGQGSAVLDRSTGIHPLQLHPDLGGVVWHHSFQTHDGRSADEAVDHALVTLRLLPQGAESRVLDMRMPVNASTQPEQDMDNDQMSLERRVGRLERANRLLAAAVVIAAGAAVLSAAGPTQVVDAIDARRIRVVDDEGRVRIDLRHDDTETGVFIMDEAGDTRLGAAQFAHGGGGYALHGPEGRGAAVLYLRGDGSLTVYDEAGAVTARFPGGQP